MRTTYIEECTFDHLAKILKNVPDPPTLLVRGLLADLPREKRARFSSFYTISGTYDAAAPLADSPWSIVLRDGGGRLLRTVGIRPLFTPEDDPTRRRLTAFAYRIPDLPQTRRVELRYRNRILTVKTIGARGPIVRIIAPGAGTISVAHGSIPVRWSISGLAPGVRPLSSVAVSTDGNAIWNTLVSEQRGTTFAVPAQPGHRYAIKVIATDGGRSTEATARVTTR